MSFKNRPPMEKSGKTETRRVASPAKVSIHFNPIALRKAQIAYNFGLSECNKVKVPFYKIQLI